MTGPSCTAGNQGRQIFHWMVISSSAIYVDIGLRSFSILLVCTLKCGGHACPAVSTSFSCARQAHSRWTHCSTHHLAFLGCPRSVQSRPIQGCQVSEPAVWPGRESVRCAFNYHHILPCRPCVRPRRVHCPCSLLCRACLAVG